MKHEIDIQVGKRLRQARWLQKMTQQQLADQVGCKFQQIQKYETGANRISASRLVMICRAMDLVPAYFFEGMGFDDQKPDENDFDRSECQAIADLRKMPPELKLSMMAMIEEVAKEQKPES